MNVSPFVRLLLEAVKSTVSALSRLAARLKLVLVRVDGSKKRFATAIPLRSSNFVSPAFHRLLYRPASSRIVSISVAVSSWSPNKCLRVQTPGEADIDVGSGMGVRNTVGKVSIRDQVASMDFTSPESQIQPGYSE